MRRTLGPWLTPILAMLAGCAQADQCVPKPRDWPFTEPRASIEGFSHYDIRVTPDGAVSWEGAETSPDEIAEYLKIAQTLQPSPHIILHADDASDCLAAERVRQRMDASTLCREGSCAESRRWEAWFGR